MPHRPGIVKVWLYPLAITACETWPRPFAIVTGSQTLDVGAVQRSYFCLSSWSEMAGAAF